MVQVAGHIVETVGNRPDFFTGEKPVDVVCLEPVSFQNMISTGCSDSCFTVKMICKRQVFYNIVFWNKYSIRISNMEDFRKILFSIML